MRVGSIFIIVLLVMSSCKVSENKGETTQDDVTDSVSGKVEMPRVSLRDGDTLRITRLIDFSYLTCKDVYCDSVNRKIIAFVQSNTSFESEGTPVTLDRTFFKDQLNYFDSIARAEERFSEQMPPWELELSTSFSKQETYIDLMLSVWSYTGGAHGNGYYEHRLIEKRTGRTLELSDFISDVPAFTLFAESYFRKQNNIKPEEDLGELGFWFQDNKFSLNENFHFEDDNILFFYNSYEIAPYSAGQIEFFIPLEDMKQFLKIQP